MSQIQPDGCVVPSFMSVVDNETAVETGWNTMYSNSSLRVGYVIAQHYPKESNHESDRRILYDVIVPQVTATGAQAMVPYYNCKVATMFGASADTEHRTLRCPKNYKGKYDEKFFKSTTKVLILCANGRNDAAYIVATDTNPAQPPDEAADGHNWTWVFNGIKWLIDKDGQFSLTFNGATVDENREDKAADPELAGTFLKFDKDGSITLDDVNGERIFVDKKNKKILIDARRKEENITDGDWTVEVKGNATLHASGNTIVNSDQKVFIGKDGASEPLVLGNQLVAALSELVNAFTSTPVIGALGQAPVTTNPGLIAALKAWQAKYGTKVAPILSKRKFTE